MGNRHKTCDDGTLLYLNTMEEYHGRVRVSYGLISDHDFARSTSVDLPDAVIQYIVAKTMKRTLKNKGL